LFIFFFFSELQTTRTLVRAAKRNSVTTDAVGTYLPSCSTSSV